MYTMYTISEAAKKLGVTRQSIYNRLVKDELSVHVTQTDRGKMLSEVGFEILKGLYNFMPDCKDAVSEQCPDINLTNSEEQSDGFGSVNTQSGYRQHTVNEGHSDKHADNPDNKIDNYIRSLVEQIEYLKSIVAEKDKQIAVKDEQILSLTRLTENSQVLLKQEQDKNKLLVETKESKIRRGLWDIFMKK